MLSVEIDLKHFPARTGGAGHTALRDVRFELADGEFVCMIGPSGSGKSTLLNIINGLDNDYQGRVDIDRARLNGSESSASAGLVATMFQTPRLMPWLSVLDNVRLVLEDTPRATQLACDLLQEMAVGDKLQAFPKQLSGGMQRRVALARAFAIQPRLLLMDEPFVSLDQPVANRLRRMLIELWQQYRATVLFVTHDLREALALADRLLFMSGNPGRVVLEYPVDLPRPRSPDDPQVSALHQQLLTDHPDLLAGLINIPEES